MSTRSITQNNPPHVIQMAFKLRTVIITVADSFVYPRCFDTRLTRQRETLMRYPVEAGFWLRRRHPSAISRWRRASILYHLDVLARATCMLHAPRSRLI